MTTGKWGRRPASASRLKLKMGDTGRRPHFPAGGLPLKMLLFPLRAVSFVVRFLVLLAIVAYLEGNRDIEH